MAGKLLLVTRRAPYGGSLARSALETALAAAAFDMAPALLFQGAGVLQLLPEQDASAIGTRTHGKVLDSLPLYEVDKLYVDASALAGYGLQEMPLPEGASLLDAAGIRALLDAYHHLLSF